MSSTIFQNQRTHGPKIAEVQKAQSEIRTIAVCNLVHRIDPWKGSLQRRNIAQKCGEVRFAVGLNGFGINDRDGAYRFDRRVDRNTRAGNDDDLFVFGCLFLSRNFH